MTVHAQGGPNTSPADVEQLLELKTGRKWNSVAQ